MACILLSFWGCARQGSDSIVSFDVKEGLARDTLKEAAVQAEVEFIFSSDLLKELKTPAIKGRYTPYEAFELMLTDSPFNVVQHEESGVYSIQRQSQAAHAKPQLDQ